MHHTCRVGVSVRVKISKNGDYKNSSESFIPLHVYDTWHGEERENIKCMEKSTWLRQDTFTETMFPRAEGNSGPWCKGDSHTLFSPCRQGQTFGKFSPLSLHISSSLDERLEQVSFKALRSRLDVEQVLLVSKEQISWQFADMPVRPHYTVILLFGREA